MMMILEVMMALADHFLGCSCLAAIAALLVDRWAPAHRANPGAAAPIGRRGRSVLQPSWGDKRM